jgi:hypothetical protein
MTRGNSLDGAVRVDRPPTLVWLCHTLLRAALSKAMGVIAARRQNLPIGWWVSPVCAFFAFAYVAAFAILYSALA